MNSKSDSGPRADPEMTLSERGALLNHLLLCGTCHDEVDLDEDAWPIERLRQTREEHLKWVGTLDEQPKVDAARLAYAEIVETVTDLVWLDAWEMWTEYMLHPALSWKPHQIDAVHELARLVHVSDWPETLPALEVAIARLSDLLSRAAETFVDRAEPREHDFHVIRKYKLSWNSNYHEDARRFQQWLMEYEGLVFEATAAANWLRSEWRRAGNADFLPARRISIFTGPHEGLEYQTHVEEYSVEERSELLRVGRDQVGLIRPWKLSDREDEPLLKLLAQITEAELGSTPTPASVQELAERIKSLEGPVRSSDLLGGLFGAVGAEEMKKICFALFKAGVLKRNDGPERGFLLGEIPAG